MENNYDEITMQKDTVSLPTDQTAEPIEPQNIKMRKRRTRAEIEAGVTLEELNSIKESDDQQRLSESVNTAVSQMKKRLGIPDSISDLVSQQQLSEWKLLYGEIYRSTLNDQSFIWHKVKRKDYIALMTDQELTTIDNPELRIFLRQEKITKSCVLYPSENILNKLIEDNAGIAGNLSDEIMLTSGFRPISSEKID